MRLWSINEMIELVSGIQGRIIVSVRIRAGSRIKRFLCFVLIDVRCFRVPPKMSLGISYGTGIPDWRYLFETIGSKLSVRLSVLRTGRPFPRGIFLVLISVRLWVDYRATVRLEGLGQLKHPVTSSPLQTKRIQNYLLHQRTKSNFY
jgi:hypothetical protein